MRIIDKGIEISGKTEEDLRDNACPQAFNLLTHSCNEDCGECWEEEYIGTFPECFKICACRVCEKHEEACCVNEKEECKGNCIVFPDLK